MGSGGDDLLSTNRVRFLSFISTVTWLVGGRACFDFRARLSPVFPALGFPGRGQEKESVSMIPATEKKKS